LSSAWAKQSSEPSRAFPPSCTLRLAELGSLPDRLRVAMDWAVQSAVGGGTAKSALAYAWPHADTSPDLRERLPAWIDTGAIASAWGHSHRRLLDPGRRGRRHLGRGCPARGLRPPGAVARGAGDDACLRRQSSPAEPPARVGTPFRVGQLADWWRARGRREDAVAIRSGGRSRPSHEGLEAIWGPRGDLATLIGQRSYAVRRSPQSPMLVMARPGASP
jgi:hypothetical protein